MRLHAWWLFAAVAAVASEPLPKPLDTILPCTDAPTRLAPAPITVTSQYQQVSTCTASSTTCERRRCRTKFDYSTFAYVSTIIPCPYGTENLSTVTATEQTVIVSRSTVTSTQTRVTPIVVTRRGKATTTSKTTISYTTLIKEWNAIYKDLGPWAILGYRGSGLCRNQCTSAHGEKIQVLKAIECKNGQNQPTVCSQWPETWIYAATPTVASTARAVCSSHAVTLPSAGTYTLAFPQRVPRTTLRIPQRVITYTSVYRHRPTVITTTVTETITVVPARQWTAFVTRSCARPTVIDIDVTVTTTIYYTYPPFTPPCPPWVIFPCFCRPSFR